MSKLDSTIEDLIVHTANEYGGFEGFDENDSRDGFNKAKSDIKILVIELVKSQPTWEKTTMIDAEMLIKALEKL